jgi:hypothetical protein
MTSSNDGEPLARALPKPAGLWMTGPKGRKSPKNLHFWPITLLRACDSWITLDRQRALGRQEDVGGNEKM